MSPRQLLMVAGLSCILFSSPVTAQTKRLTLRSDFPSKTLLVTNSNQEVGAKSPFLVAATSGGNNMQTEYRSLLQFNYEFLPDVLLTDPQMIASAELVLFPVNADFLENKFDKTSKLVVKRITSDWYDSLTGWDNLPMVDTSSATSDKIRMKKKDWQVRVNVTYLVQDMIKYGNRGFMISQNNASLSNSLSGLSFASSLNDDKSIRPLLVITYNDGTDPVEQRVQQQKSQRPVSAPTYSTPPRSGGSGSN